MEASGVRLRTLQHLRRPLHLKIAEGCGSRRIASTHCVAKNFQAVSFDYGTQSPLAQGTLVTVAKQENQTDCVEDEELREKLERKQNSLPFRFVMEP